MSDNCLLGAYTCEYMLYVGKDLNTVFCNGFDLFQKIFLEKLFDGNTEDMLWPRHPVFTIYCFVP